MKIIKLLSLFVLLISLSLSSFSQQRGAFTDVYVKRILFPDIPAQVKTYIDSQGVFASVKRVLFQTFDVNGFPSDGTSFTYIGGFGGDDTVKTIITPSKSGKILTLSNTLKYTTGEEDFTREVIEYNTLNQAIKVNIDTSIGGINYATKYQYTYAYDNAGRVSQADQYNRTSKGFYIIQGTAFVYNVSNKPASLTTVNYDKFGTVTSTQQGAFFYRNEKLDSLVVKNMSTNTTSGKFIAFYKDSKIYKTDTYQNLFDELFFTGSTWYYDYNPMAIDEKEAFNELKIVNPVGQNLTFLNVPAKPFELMNYSGNIVATGMTNTAMDVSSLPAGFYTVRVKGDYSNYTKKIIKE